MEIKDQTIDIQSARALHTVIVTIVIFIMSAIFMSKVSRIDAEMERVAINQTLTVVRSGMQIYVFSKMIDGKHSELSTLEGVNPIQLLGVPPTNYLGEIDDEQSTELHLGYWYFDKKHNELVYKIRYENIFVSQYPDREMRFKVSVAYDDTNKNNRYDVRVDELNGLRLTPVQRKRFDLVVAENAEYGNH